MSAFRDGNNREWTIAITCGSLKRIEQHAKFDLADLDNGKAYQIFAGDHHHLVDVLWPLLKGQCEAKGITQDDLSDSIWGKAIEDSIAAIKESLLDFFPPSRRPLAQAAVTKVEKELKLGVELGIARIESDPIVTDSGGIALTSAPESSASTQTTGPSESCAPPATPG
jgi:hypothetical protein